MRKNILAADIGGTNSRFAHFQMDENGSLTPMGTIWLATTAAGSFPELLAQLRQSDAAFPVDAADIAVIAVAGPVQHGTYSAPPYISWDIDLSSSENKRVFPQGYLINDFVAQAYACLSPVGRSARTILAGKADPEGTIGVIGAGTALGKALLVPLPGNRFVALPTEGGHAYFPFISRQEMEFQEFYREKSGLQQITANLVVSGRGLRYIHWFLLGEELEPQEVAARFTPESATLAWAAKFYGRVCRDFALDALATGGLYIAGGVAAANPGILAHADFRREFLDSPTMGHILANIPLFLVDNQDSGLWGAACYGRQILQKG
jgi:glucokinase